MSKARAVHTIESLKARTIEEGDCWLWQGYSVNGTPQVCEDGKMVPTRRVMTRLAGKTLKPGLHYFVPTCGNDACVNPEHTVQRSPRTHMGVMGKMASVGAVKTLRVAKAAEARRKSSKLGIDAANAIRQAEGTYLEIAERFGCHKSMVGRIRRGEQWKDHANPFGALMR